MKNEKIEDLFLMMTMKNEDSALAESAFNEFHRRYIQYIYDVVKKYGYDFTKVYGQEIIDATVNNTLLTIYEKADRFIQIESIDEASKDKRIKAWIGRIAQREFFMLLRNEKKANENIEYNSESEVFNNDIVDEEPEEVSVSFEMKLLITALNSLPVRDKEILLTLMRYEESGKYTPTEVIDELCTMYNTTDANIRKIKSRSIAKIKMIVQSSTQHTYANK
jgi:DNA-directed RNA polymerase specialized sigma24 family protein